MTITVEILSFINIYSGFICKPNLEGYIVNDKNEWSYGYELLDNEDYRIHEINDTHTNKKSIISGL